jgi:pimeloyl-ACP methyl ester carboxylesterase
MRVIYLHGFASSPQSGKAQFFARKLADSGVRCDVPALDGGDFRSLTIGGQLAVIEEIAAGEPVRLIGSSLGGYLAALYASRHPETERVVLLAPAFCFGSRYPPELGEETMREWKRNGFRKIYHYGFGEERELSYRLVEDGAKYEDYPEFSQPALILHGRNDDVVPVSLSETFAASHANARLIVLDSDHQLSDVTETLWAETSAFFQRK